MTGLRILAFCIGLVVILPMVALNKWGFQMSMWVNKEVSRNEAMLDGAAEVPAATPMPTSPLAWLRNRSELNALFSRDEINPQRVVTVTEIIDPADLLAPGEAGPDAVFLPLYAEARAPAQLSRYCADVLSALGGRCDVLSSSATINREGKVVLTGQLGFRPDAVLGDPSQVSDGQVISGSIRLPHSGDLRPAYDQAARVAAMQQAQAICDALRAEFGNCVLTRTELNIEELWITDLEVLPAGTNPQRLIASATYKIYANPATLDRTRLGTRLQDLSAGL
ncbi:hypothetical protein SLH49_04205 [Cognatiyoonia sp. IB215446]|uniref:hypothetical protein n=1 Tax=Cognatiyoonia sp. IB215446 TaxID=3097355 RepID=UPI002A1727DA|nr:hypothetical protein [Cognatiyoonia sp. IB215446]MDX8347183.1 hypothetical protein [Cognatiyoonia sp. IB215446]